MNKVEVLNSGTNELPTYATTSSSGMDVKADLTNPDKIKIFEGSIEFHKEHIVVNPQSRILIPSGLKIAIPEGFEIQVRSRSGKSLKEGLCVVQGVGTIDSDYRGEVGICLINLSAFPQKIKQSERVAQLVMSKVETFQWKNVKTLSETVRGEGGFGHTGKE